MLRAWYNAQNKYFNIEKKRETDFLRLILTENLICNISHKQGRIRHTSEIIDQDNIGATDRGTRGNITEILDMYRQPHVQYEINCCLRDYVSNLLNDGCWEENCQKFFKELRRALELSCDNKVEKDIDLERLGRILEYVDKDKENSKEIREALYFYSFYAITKTLPEQFGNALYENYEKDFREYCTLIVENLGVYTFQGMSTLYALAERAEPNVCALYAVGELEYYGRGPSNTRNIPRAYEYYKKVVKRNATHPRALWAIADLKFSYLQMKKDFGQALEIEEFETCLGKPEWYLGIVKDAKRAALYGSAAGENLLGRIIVADEKEFPSTYKGELKEESAEEHFKRAAEKGYAFGYVNLAKMMSRKKKEVQSTEDKSEYNRLALNYLKKAADLGISHASNKLSRCYLGKDRDITVEKNEGVAYHYAEEALIYAKMMHHMYYPFLNIVKYFYANPQSKYFNHVEKEMQLLYLNNAEEAADGIPSKKYKKVMAEIEKLRNFINENCDCNNLQK